MILATLHKISKSFAGIDIFTGISLQVKTGDKIGLIGRNGIGKTTLFRILLGELSADAGELARAKGVRIGYLPQEVRLDKSLTLLDEVTDAFSHLIGMKKRIEELELIIASGADKAILTEYGHLQERFEREGGFTYQSRIEDALTGLGFLEEEFQKPLNLFSGGEKSRAYLAKLLLSLPDILLLDEPTNHLDISSTEWLESYLIELDAAVIIVSHDRLFLNRTTKLTLDFRPDRIEEYAGNFDFYLKERKARQEQQSKLYQRQKEEILRIEDFIQRNIAGQKTKQAQSRRTMLSKIKRLTSPETDGKAATLRIESSGRSYRKLLEVNGLSKSFVGRTIFSDISFEIERGEKIGLIGPNGSGKSTLVKIITGELEPDDGEFTIGGNVKPAYFDQELSIIATDDTVLDSIWEEKPLAEAGELRSYLGRYLFSGEDVFKSVSALSGGEKSRLALAKIFLLPANFLILDEPTNHLDIPSSERLEEALAEYDGAALIVSHDRFFLDKTVSKIFALENGSLRVIDGNYSEYVRLREAQDTAIRTETDIEERMIEKEARLNEWKDLKEKRRVRKQFEKLEDDIQKKEQKMLAILDMLEDESIQSDWERLAELQKSKQQIEAELDELLRQYDEFDLEE
ncbi:MAG: ABC-F family ATP-binding cassette domain-containing protein [Candidatus Zixiibacteriota bacterium]